MVQIAVWEDVFNNMEPLGRLFEGHQASQRSTSGSLDGRFASGSLRPRRR